MRQFTKIALFSFHPFDSIQTIIKALEELPIAIEHIDDLSQLDKHDLLMVIGGDGSMITAARACAPRHIPLVGIHLGKLGFLTDIYPHECVQCLRDILAGKYLEEKRPLLQLGHFEQGEHTHLGLAMNEIVLHRSEHLQMINYDLYVNDRFLHSHYADGMIISTPTGSTAYALSAGGPLVHPHLKATLLIPLCSHKLNAKPLIISMEDSIKIVFKPEKSSQGAIYLDGRLVKSVQNETEFHVSTAPDEVTLIHPTQYDYLHTLKTKLGWQ